jgi:hypothetical protein
MARKLSAGMVAAAIGGLLAAAPAAVDPAGSVR